MPDTLSKPLLPTLSLHPLSPKTFEVLSHISQSCFQDVGKHLGVDLLHRLWDQRRLTGWTLHSLATCVGYALFSSAPHLPHAELMSFAISPKNQGLGYGKYILKQAIAYLPSQIKEIWLEVRSTNHAALSLYQSLGFQRQSKPKRYYGSDKQAVQFILKRSDTFFTNNIS